MNVDDLIRETVRRQEELAVDTGRVLAGLPARAARRQRVRTRAVLATVVAAVAVAVAVPLVVLGDNGSVAPATVRQETVPMYYRPTWLPDGMVEQIRSVSFPSDTGTFQSWERPPSAGRPGASVLLLARRQEPRDVSRQPNVDINGTPGYSERGSVTWQADENTELVLIASSTDGAITEEDSLRIARSVEPDPTPMRLPLQFGWLPGDGSMGEGGPRVRMKGYSPREWEATVIAYDSEHYVRASSGTVEDFFPFAGTDDGETVVVNGRTAQLVPIAQEEAPLGMDFRTDWVLKVDLGGNRHLTVYSGTAENLWGVGPLSRDDMLRIAENIQFDPHPDVEWLGRR